MRSKLNKTTITEALAKGVPAGKAHVMLWDELKGLGLKVRPSGSASWIYVYRPVGAGPGEPSRTLTLGTWPALDAVGARAAAAVHAGKRALGGDPAKEIVERKRRERWTVEAAVAGYEQDLARRKFINIKTRVSSLRAGLAPYMHRELASLTREDLMKALEARENAGLTSDDLRKGVNGMMNLYITKGVIKGNPLAGVVRPRATREELLRQEEKGRALDDAEIVRVWRACGEMGSFGNMMRMALLTACRKNELSGLRWSDITDDNIVISATVAKMARTQYIPITPMMREILDQQRLLRGTAGDKALVFPSSVGPETRISGWTPLLARLRALAGFQPRGDAKTDPFPEDWWSPHDLRRTCRTIMSVAGVQDDLGEIAIGHASALLLRLYNKDRREAGVRDAFTKVDAYISKLLPEDGDAGAGADNKIVALSGQRKRKRAA